MWNVLGKEAMYVEIGDIWKERIVEILTENENGAKFKELMDKTEVKHLFNGSTEIHNFLLDVPKDMTPEDIQFMADMILEAAKNLELPFITLEGKYQKTQVIISNEDEPELLGMNRTEGFASGKIFMPIFDSLSKPGRMNDTFDS